MRGGAGEVPRATSAANAAGGAAPFSFELDGRPITADWISATWSTRATPEIVNVTAHFDSKRYPKLAPTMAVQLYNFRSAAQPIVSQREANPLRTTTPVFSLAFSDDKDRVGRISETSRVDDRLTGRGGSWPTPVPPSRAH